MLSIQSEECAKRLQALKNEVVPPLGTNANPMIYRMSIDTAASARSITDSILSLYGHQSLYETPSESQSGVLETGSVQVDHARVSRMIEDHIRKSAVVYQDRPDSPIMLPCTTKHIEGLEVEHFNDLPGTHLGIFTNFYEDISDQHQYDSERFVSGSLRRHTCGISLEESSFLILSSVVQYYANGKDWRPYELSITLTHRVCLLRLDGRPMMILDSLVRQPQLQDTFTLRRLVVPLPWDWVMGMMSTMRYTYRMKSQDYPHLYLTTVLRAANESYVARSYELCLNGQIKESTSCININQKPLALYQQWAQERQRMTFFIIRLKNVAGT